MLNLSGFLFSISMFYTGRVAGVRSICHLYVVISYLVCYVFVMVNLLSFNVALTLPADSIMLIITDKG